MHFVDACTDTVLSLLLIGLLTSRTILDSFLHGDLFTVGNCTTKALAVSTECQKMLMRVWQWLPITLPDSCEGEQLSIIHAVVTHYSLDSIITTRPFSCRQHPHGQLGLP